eukprot:7916356-Lingulodinium_polyedra.AAC.1
MARRHARPWGLQQNHRHTAATPRVGWRFLRQERKEHAAATRRGTSACLSLSLRACTHVARSNASFYA